MGMNELHLSKKDFKIEWFSGTGAGGQHRNKHQNCCRITHIETGLCAQGTEHRERTQNQREAFVRLAKRVIDYYQVTESNVQIRSKEVIRNYHETRNEVHDKASGLRLTYRNVVIDADLSEMIEARHAALIGGDGNQKE